MFGPPKNLIVRKNIPKSFIIGILKTNRVRVSTRLGIILFLLGIPIYIIILRPLNSVRECKISRISYYML